MIEILIFRVGNFYRIYVQIHVNDIRDHKVIYIYQITSNYKCWSEF